MRPVMLPRINQMLLQNSWKLLLLPCASPLIMVLSEVFCLILLFPSLSPQPTLTCWDRCSRLVEDISSLRTYTQSSIPLFHQGFHHPSALAWCKRRVSPFIPVYQLAATSMPGVFQRDEGVSLPSSPWFYTKWHTSSALCHHGVTSWMCNLLDSCQH